MTAMGASRVELIDLQRASLRRKTRTTSVMSSFGQCKKANLHFLLDYKLQKTVTCNSTSYLILLYPRLLAFSSFLWFCLCLLVSSSNRALLVHEIWFGCLAVDIPTCRWPCSLCTSIFLADDYDILRSVRPHVPQGMPTYCVLHYIVVVVAICLRSGSLLHRSSLTQFVGALPKTYCLDSIFTCTSIPHVSRWNKSEIRTAGAWECAGCGQVGATASHPCGACFGHVLLRPYLWLEEVSADFIHILCTFQYKVFFVSCYSTRWEKWKKKQNRKKPEYGKEKHDLHDLLEKAFRCLQVET